MTGERLQELASLDALGALPPAEQQALATALAGQPELRPMADRLLAARDALAGTVPPLAPPPRVRARLLAELAARQKPPGAVPPAPAAGLGESVSFWLLWAVAAAGVVAAVNWYMDKGELAVEVRRQQRRVEEITRVADGLRGATNRLQASLAVVQALPKLEDVRVIPLAAVPSDLPKAAGACLWDQARQGGWFVAQNLRPLPANQEYALWIIDPKSIPPIAAGAFPADADGNVRYHFQASAPVANARKFLVTVEPRGGQPSPTFKTMVLLSW